MNRPLRPLTRSPHHASPSRRIEPVRSRRRRRMAPSPDPVNRTRPAPVAVVAVVITLIAAACSGGRSTKSSSPAAGSAQALSRPNIVFILTDDLSWNLVNEQIAPHIMQLEQQGETFDHCFRRGLVVLPVAFDDLHWSVSTRHPRCDEPAAGRRVPEVPSRRSREADVRRRVAIRRVCDVDARQISQRLRRSVGQHRHESQGRQAGPTCSERRRLPRRARLVGLARRQQNGLRRDQLLAERQRQLELLSRRVQLRRRRDQLRDAVVHPPTRDDAVHGRGRDLCPAQALHTRPAQRQRLPRARRTARPIVQREEHQPARLARPTPAADSRADLHHRRELPQARPSRRSGRQARCRHRGHARGRALRATRPTSSSARTTAITPASTAC